MYWIKIYIGLNINLIVKNNWIKMYGLTYLYSHKYILSKISVMTLITFFL